MKTLILALICAMLCGSSVALADNDSEKGGHEFLGIMTHPYTSFGVDRVSGPDQWATAMDFGIEVDATEGAFVDVKLTLHDVLTNEMSQVYEWDSTFKIRVGWYW